MDCKNNLIYVEGFRRCGTTCDTYLQRKQCSEDDKKLDGCTCEAGTVLNEQVSQLAHMILYVYGISIKNNIPYKDMQRSVINVCQI